jgi:hypothetical protein
MITVFILEYVNVITCKNFLAVKLEQQLQPASGLPEGLHCSYCLASRAAAQPASGLPEDLHCNYCLASRAAAQPASGLSEDLHCSYCLASRAATQLASGLSEGRTAVTVLLALASHSSHCSVGCCSPTSRQFR